MNSDQPAPAPAPALAPAPAPAPVAVPARRFSAARRITLDALTNLMIPASRDGKMPAAAGLGLYDDSSALPAPVREHFERGLDALAAGARSAHGRGFAELAAADAHALVDRLREADPAFVAAFTLHTTARYLQHDEVMRALGLEPRPNWPQGFQVPDGDWSLLEPVRRRGPIWRAA